MNREREVGDRCEGGRIYNEIRGLERKGRIVGLRYRRVGGNIGKNHYGWKEGQCR